MRWPGCAARAAFRRARSAPRAGGSQRGPGSPSKKALIAARHSEAALVELARRDKRYLAPAEAEVESAARFRGGSAAADAVVEAAHDKDGVSQASTVRRSIGTSASASTAGLSASASPCGPRSVPGSDAVATNIGCAAAAGSGLRHLARQRRDLVDALDLGVEQPEPLLRIGAKGELERDAGADRGDRRRRDEQLDDQRVVLQREVEAAGRPRPTGPAPAKRTRPSHPAARNDLLGIHLALHAQAVQLAARALPVLDHAGQARVDETALGLAGLDVALDARRGAARGRKAAPAR